MTTSVVKPRFGLLFVFLCLGNNIIRIQGQGHFYSSHDQTENCAQRLTNVGNRKCGRRCDLDRDCIGILTCKCDGACGKSCINPNLRCHPTPTISHGHVDTDNGNRFAAIAQYRCNDGYTLVGLPARICQGDGTWRGESPRCELDHELLGDKNQYCGPPPEVPNTNNTADRRQTKFKLSTYVRYHCQFGFKQQRSSVDTAWCVRGGVWVGPHINCTSSGCPEPADILNGYVKSSDQHTPGTKASYFCHQDYFLVGHKERTCLENGTWDGYLPSCEMVVCGPPPLVEHAVHNSSKTQYRFMTGTQLTYNCQYGYYKEGSNRAMCSGVEGKWVGPNMSCRARDCGDPGNIHKGWRDPGYRFPYPTGVTYKCNEGYELVGDAIRKCMANGEWSGALPTCKPIHCPELGPPLHGTRIGSRTAFGSVIKFVCNNGFNVVGSDERTCKADGTWSGKNASCKEINCGPLGPLWNGYLDGHRTTVGGVYFYRCNIRTKFSGPDFSTQCLVDGKWSNPLPKCLGQCQIPSIHNGTVNLARQGVFVNHGAVIEPRCLNGRVVNDSRPVTCNNGTWSIIPKCVPAPCNSPPPLIENGHRVFFSLAHESQARYFCFAGYKLTGKAQYLKCELGKWIGTRPMCEENFCPSPGKLENGEIKQVGVQGKYNFAEYISSITHGRRLIYMCNRDHRLVGPRGAACVNGKWSPQERPKCERSRHPIFNKLWRPFEEKNKKPIYY